MPLHHYTITPIHRYTATPLYLMSGVVSLVFCVFLPTPATPGRAGSTIVPFCRYTVK